MQRRRNEPRALNPRLAFGCGKAFCITLPQGLCRPSPRSARRAKISGPKKPHPASASSFWCSTMLAALFLPRINAIPSEFHSTFRGEIDFLSKAISKPWQGLLRPMVLKNSPLGSSGIDDPEHQDRPFVHLSQTIEKIMIKRLLPHVAMRKVSVSDAFAAFRSELLYPLCLLFSRKRSNE